MDFDQVIAPLTRQQFLSEHWNRAFLHMKGEVGRFTGLLGWDELNTLLEQHRLGPPRLKLVRDGRPLDPANYLSPGLSGLHRLDSGKLVTCLAAGATLVLDAVEEMAPRVRDLADSFRDVLGSGNYVNLYAGWHSQNGFDLHWDSQDAIILQLTGQKRWQIFAPPRLHPLQDDIEPPPRPTDPPVWDGMIEDGDALYIPRGWWHMAYPVNEPSLHLTFTTVSPNGMDLIRWMTAKLRHHSSVRADLPMSDDLAGQQACLAEIRALIDGAMADDLVRDFRREWLADSFPRPHVRLPKAPYEQLAPIDDDNLIQLAAAHQLSFIPRDANVEFRANGMLYVVSTDLAPALGMLSDSRARSVAELSAQVTGDAAVANLKQTLADMARAGIVFVTTA